MTTNAAADNIVERAFAPGWSAGFAVLFKEAPFVQQVGCYRGRDGDSHRFDFFWRTMMDRVGGGPTVDAAATLIADNQGRPLVYTLYSHRSPLRAITFDEDGAHVELADGSTHIVPLQGRPDFVFQGNLIVQLGIFLVLHPPPGGKPARARLFSPEAMAVRDLTLTRGEDGRIETSLGFDVTVQGSRVTEIRSQKAPGSIAGIEADVMMPEADFADYRKSQTPSYVPPPDLPIRVEEVDIECEDGPLGGAFSYPTEDGGRFPAFLFLQGSGALDRHGAGPGLSVGTHALCDRLSAAGFAGLRIDARGTGRTRFGRLGSRVFAARCADAMTAFDWLAGRPEVDQDRVFFIGHSLGALVVLTILRDRPNLRIAGLVLMAAPGRGMGRILAAQAKREFRRTGMDPETVSARRKALAEWLRRVRNGTLPQHQAPALSSSFTALADQQVFGCSPPRLLVAAARPVLLCQGAKDIQVSLEDDALPLTRAASDAGLDAELRVFANLDHLFRREAGQSSPASYFEWRPLDSMFVRSVIDWLRARAGHC